MVKIEIQLFVEGGVLEHQNIAVETVNNSNKLRESLHQLLSQLVAPEKFDLVVLPRGGYKQTIKDFKADLEKDNQSLLLIDLDAPKSQKDTQIAAFELTEIAEKVFFMVQKMEAWILSQPDKIELFAQNKKLRIKNADKTIAQNPLLKGKHPEEIENPDDKLKTIFSQHFEKYEERRDKYKPANYGKLKDAPELLALLDFSRLLQDFEDVKLLQVKIESYAI
jgi:hypothetical protein